MTPPIPPLTDLQPARFDRPDLLKRVAASMPNQHRFYSQDLVNNLFSHPYTKIEFVQADLGVSRLTATKYLDALATTGFVVKHKIGRSNYYINTPLYRILTGDAMTAVGP